MSALVFLLGFVVLTAVGALVVWLRERRPRSWDSGMDEFARTLRALSPEAPVDDGSERSRGRRRAG